MVQFVSRIGEVRQRLTGACGFFTWHLDTSPRVAAGRGDQTRQLPEVHHSALYNLGSSVAGALVPTGIPRGPAWASRMTEKLSVPRRLGNIREGENALVQERRRKGRRDNRDRPEPNKFRVRIGNSEEGRMRKGREP